MQPKVQGGLAIDPESQQPIQATDVQPVVEAQPENIRYIVIEEHPRYNLAQNDDDPRIACAAVGLIFSWIPIIGFLTWVLNCDAPRQSPRAALANAACGIATIVVVFTVFFCGLFYGW